MSISPTYFEYLTHFGQTETLYQLHKQPASNMIALRHDVDHDLDLALEMAWHEHDRNCAATYFLLHTAPYWQDPHLIEKCLQLQDFGHEVSLHINALTEWYAGTIDDVAKSLQNILMPLAEAGVKVKGISAHGDKACYHQSFINYWCFAEFKPDDPSISENGLSAEGIKVIDPAFQIPYPESEILRRADGQTFDLWSLSASEIGIEYDACHLQFDKYFTDSGGNWIRSENPLSIDLSEDRHQILMHPIHWRGPQKVFFFLSAARSGSKWLTNMLDQATPLSARHEFTLNHSFAEGEPKLVKRTGPGFVQLAENKEKIRELLGESHTFVQKLPNDYAEANVYLEQFIPELQEEFPEAQLIHLFRQPRDVVRSIMNRDWYAAPEDNAHPRLDVPNFEQLPQFAKACWYVRKANETLSKVCKRQIKFERMVNDEEYLREKLKLLDIPYYPRLAAREFQKVINANQNNQLPVYDHWSPRQKRIFDSILGKMDSASYGCTLDFIESAAIFIENARFSLISLFRKVLGTRAVAIPLDLSREGITCKNCDVEHRADGLFIKPDGKGHAHVLMAGGSWKKTSPPSGFEIKSGHYYKGSLSSATPNQNHQASIMCLVYNKSGNLLSKQNLAAVSHESPRADFAFRPKVNAGRFNLAIYIPVGKMQQGLTVNDIDLHAVPYLEKL
ncbi:hypothetical protein STSP2_02802 [Anaerohalosphaera lusitana]|uniref:Sulfotransferase family protein n=1 Tax=Anaerohalosphaera lusitana TaxID=1936003 RepID=A0A1U9NPG6_9BACT|nr:sulfotransferase [Anaerohalosphaera lusitana]AQT69608.1 hypothetical protein STSP2_02802 [Anaerohalosphaera lusitana]